MFYTHSLPHYQAWDRSDSTVAVQELEIILKHKNLTFLCCDITRKVTRYIIRDFSVKKSLGKRSWVLYSHSGELKTQGQWKPWSAPLLRAVHTEDDNDNYKCIGLSVLLIGVDGRVHTTTNNYNDRGEHYRWNHFQNDLMNHLCTFTHPASKSAAGQFGL